MSDLTLSYPVRTLENQELLSAGTALTAETLNALISSKSVTHKKAPLLRHGTVKRDILEFVGIPPFETIYCTKEKITCLFEDLDAINIELPVLEAMDYFKQSDFYTYRHFLMVYAISTLLAKDLIPGYEDRIRLAKIGPTHDIGKSCVPIEVLKKTTPLTRAEKAMLDNHCLAGYVLLSYYLGDPGGVPSEGCHPRRVSDAYKRQAGLSYT